MGVSHWLALLLALTAVSSSHNLLDYRHLPKINKNQTVVDPSNNSISSELTEESNSSSNNIYHKYLTTNNEEQGYVTGGSLVSFSNLLLAQEKADILDSLLFAELTASDSYDRTERFSDWYNLYFEVLQKTGWAITPIRFTQYDPSQSHFKLTTAIYNLLAPNCHGVQKEVSTLTCTTAA